MYTTPLPPPPLFVEDPGGWRLEARTNTTIIQVMPLIPPTRSRDEGGEGGNGEGAKGGGGEMEVVEGVGSGKCRGAKGGGKGGRRGR